MKRFATLVAGLALVGLVTPRASADLGAVGATVDGLRGDIGARAITFVGEVRDHPDLSETGLGTAGHWFPHFGAVSPVTGAPTGSEVRDALPSWIGALNHTTDPTDPGCAEPQALQRGCTPTYYFRTFSQDGPARSAGGSPAWARLRLPSGECGVSGAIVDPQTFVADQELDDPTGFVAPRMGDAKPNTNNTVNRLQLRGAAPSSFFVSIVTDNTAREHDPGLLEIRGNAGLLDVPSVVASAQVEATYPASMELSFNEIPDVYVFRVDGFTVGDYLKLRLRGSTASASFGGLLFDEHLDLAALHHAAPLEAPLACA